MQCGKVSAGLLCPFECYPWYCSLVLCMVFSVLYQVSGTRVSGFWYQVQPYCLQFRCHSGGSVRWQFGSKRSVSIAAFNYSAGSVSVVPFARVVDGGAAAQPRSHVSEV